MLGFNLLHDNKGGPGNHRYGNNFLFQNFYLMCASKRVLSNNHYATLINVHSNHGIPTLCGVIFNAFWANILFSFNTLANAWQCPFVCQCSSPNNFNMHGKKKNMTCCMHLQVRVDITWWRRNVYRIICPLCEGNPPVVVGSVLVTCILHYTGVTMSAMVSQITSPTIVYSTVYSGEDQRKHQSSASPAFVRGIHRWPVNSSHKRPVTRKMFPFDDVIMQYRFWCSTGLMRGESTGHRWFPLTKDQ